jgi:hypothetical protein
MTIQFFIAGPVIFAGWALGYKSADVLPPNIHFFDTHQKCGLVLLILYLVQLTLGLTSHFFKFPTIFHGHRAPQNYLHAVVAIAIFILAAFQVRNISNSFAVAFSRLPSGMVEIKRVGEAH